LYLTLTHSFSLSRSLTNTHIPAFASLSISLSLSHTHTNTHKDTHTHIFLQSASLNTGHTEQCTHLPHTFPLVALNTKNQEGEVIHLTQQKQMTSPSS